MGDSLAFGRSPPSAEEVGVHSLEEEEGEVGRLQVNREEGEAAAAVVDHYLGAVEGAAVVVLQCRPAEGEEEVVVVLSDLGGEVEGVGEEEVAAKVPQPSGSARWRPG